MSATFRPLDALRTARDLPGLSVVDFAVLTALILRCDGAASAFPSFPTLAKDARCSERASKTAMARLKSAGHVSVRNRSTTSGLKTSNFYVVHLVHDVVQDVHDSSAPRALSDVHHVHLGSAPRARDLPKEICPERTAQDSSLTLAGMGMPSEAPKATKPKRATKYTPEQSALRAQLVEHYTACWVKRGLERADVKIDGGDMAQAWELVTLGSEKALRVIELGVAGGCPNLKSIARDRLKLLGGPARKSAGSPKQSDASWGVPIGEEVWRKPKSEGGGLQ